MDYRNAYGSEGGYVRDRYADNRMSDRYPDERRGGRYDYNSDMEGDFYGDRHKKAHSKTLTPDKLMRWSRTMMMDIDDNYKQYFKMEQIITKAEQMGIEFEKFTPEEFYTTVVMMFTDFFRALGSASIDIYIKLAKAWLCDADVSVKYGKKLAKYYEEIVEDV